MPSLSLSESRELRQMVIGCPRWGKAVQFVLKNLENLKDQTILDLGCGTGVVGVFLALHGANIIGLDLDPKALKMAQDLAANFGQQDACSFLVGSGEAMAVGTETVDIVFSRSTLQYMDRSRAMSECLRVLKPGGIMILLQNLPSNPFLKIFRLIRRWRSRDDDARAYVESIKGYVTLPELHSLESAFSGFEWEFYHLLDVPTVELRRHFKKSRLLLGIEEILDRIDTLAFNRIPFLRKLAWFVAVVYKGKKGDIHQAGDRNAPAL